MNSQKRIQPFVLMVVLLMNLAVASANAQSRVKEFKAAQQPAATRAYSAQVIPISSWISRTFSLLRRLL